MAHILQVLADCQTYSSTRCADYCTVENLNDRLQALASLRLTVEWFTSAEKARNLQFEACDVQLIASAPGGRISTSRSVEPSAINLQDLPHNAPRKTLLKNIRGSGSDRSYHIKLDSWETTSSSENDEDDNDDDYYLINWSNEIEFYRDQILAGSLFLHSLAPSNTNDYPASYGPNRDQRVLIMLPCQLRVVPRCAQVFAHLLLNHQSLGHTSPLWHVRDLYIDCIIARLRTVSCSCHDEVVQ